MGRELVRRIEGILGEMAQVTREYPATPRPVPRRRATVVVRLGEVAVLPLGLGDRGRRLDSCWRLTFVDSQDGERCWRLFERTAQGLVQQPEGGGWRITGIQSGELGYSRELGGIVLEARVTCGGRAWREPGGEALESIRVEAPGYERGGR